MRDFPDLIDYPAKMLKPIVALKGTNHLPDKEKLEFDGEIDQPYSLIIGDLGTGRMSFYLNRCPCILPSPLPCTIQVLGASLKSDLSRSIVVQMELQHQIQTLAAPYVHQALLDCCRQGGHSDPNLDALILSRPTKNTIQNDPGTTITTQFKVKQANPVLCTLLPPAQLDHQQIVGAEASGVPVETFHAVDPKSFDSHYLRNVHQDLRKYSQSGQKACKMENCSSPSSLSGLGQAESCRVADTDRLSNLTAATSLPGRVASSAVLGMNTGMKTGLMAIGGVLALSLAIAQQATPQESA